MRASQGSRLPRSTVFDSQVFPSVLCLCLLLALSTAAGGASVEKAADRPDECAKIADNAVRLACYDELAVRGPAEKDAESYLSRLWDLDTESRRKGFALRPHRFNYILPYTYNATPSKELLQADPGREIQNQEVKFQISFKTKLWEDVLGKDMDLWIAYTQLSFWQFYDFQNSAPFRETDYEPELLLNFRTNYNIPGLRGRYISVGINHQSNGRSRPLSRSWNRVVADFGFERERLTVILKTWYRIPEDEKDDDNPGIDRFLGYGQIDVHYHRDGHLVGLSVRNNLRAHGNKGAVQLEWSFPLFPYVSGYIQYFNGYGESLLDYRASVNRIGAGFILKEW
jgi:phospholipase A1